MSTERTHYKIGSRKSKLAMVQSEYIAGRLQKENPSYTFEIVNFDTKGDQVLNVSLMKIGDKGLFTKELEDALENNTIDFVVHSLKDMPCQTMPANLILSGVPEREDPSDALVVAERLRETKFTLDDLDENSVIGTSSMRRISQLRFKYPNFKFETIRGNLQTRFKKLDDNDAKYDAIILATAGLKRMGYADRITQLLPYDICMHAVSQGALGIECRLNDLQVIKMINQLNHEETLLRCIAERTFLARIEGGCSAPVGVISKVTDQSISLEGVVLSADGTQRIFDKFEINFNNSNVRDCPMVTMMNEAITTNLKHKLDDELDHENETLVEEVKRTKTPNDYESIEPIIKQFSFIVDLNFDQNKMIKAELCGLHLAQRLKDKGADVIIRECKEQVQALLNKNN